MASRLQFGNRREAIFYPNDQSKAVLATEGISLREHRPGGNIDLWEHRSGGI